MCLVVLIENCSKDGKWSFIGISMSHGKNLFYVLATMSSFGIVVYYTTGAAITGSWSGYMKGIKGFASPKALDLTNTTVLIKTARQKSDSHPATNMTSSTQSNVSNIQQIYKSKILEPRIRNVNRYCQMKLSDTIRVRGRSPVFFYSKQANLLVCKAPKTGSSFWATLIIAMHSNTNTDDIFSTDRNSVHYRNEIDGSTAQKLNKSELKVLVSRDPYTRIYSAFIDKYFLLTRLGRNLKLMFKTGMYKMNESSCGFNISFPLFLKYVVDTAFAGKDVNEHHLPVTQLCDPCKTQYDIVSKTESLTRDTQYILDHLNIERSKKQALQTVLRSSMIKSTIHSLVLSHLGDYKNHRKDCPDRVSHFEKVWKTFHIQGLVSSKIPYPKREFQKLIKFDAGKITSIILKEIEKVPLSTEARKRQREEAVALAYKDVPPDILEKIKRIYKMDFLLFGYDMTPPHERLNSTSN